VALVDQLIVALPREEGPYGRYDEQRGVTLDAEGRPLVAETREITEIAGERDEPETPRPPDRDDDLQIETVRTFVEREVDDIAAAEPRVYLTRTETFLTRTETFVTREQPDHEDSSLHVYLTRTETQVLAEQPDHVADDAARAYLTRTETSIVREQPDYDGWSSERDGR
jgi:hypothetical protein